MLCRLVRLTILSRYVLTANFCFAVVIAATAVEAGNPPKSVSLSVVDDHIRAASVLSTLDADTVPSPGVQIGLTCWDAQHNNAMGHQIATNPGADIVHFVWTMWDVVPDDPSINQRYVNYSGWDKLSGSQLWNGFNGMSISRGQSARGGFPRIDVDGANLAHATFHQYGEPGCCEPYTTWHLYFPILGSSLSIGSEMPEVTQWQHESEMVWADVAVSQNTHTAFSGDNDVWHVIAMGSDDRGQTFLASDRIWYWRQVGAWPADPIVWEGPALIDSTTSLGYTIDACDDSGKVAIAFHSNYRTDLGGTLNRMNNVVYRESHNDGASWLIPAGQPGSELGESYKNFITTFSDPEGPEAYSETSVAYDHDGVLNIVYDVQRIACHTEQAALYHYSNARGTSRPITTAYYANSGTWGGHLNFCQISLGIGDGATLCTDPTQTNENYLYVMYTKLGGETPEEQADTSKLGFSNGELYLTASIDGGDHWSRPVNLTNTKSPNCHSDDLGSLCSSEAWGTIVRDVHDLDILYIRDFEAASKEEGPWTMNRVMYLSFPGGIIDADFLCPLFPCDCPCIGDPQCDAATDVLDVVQAVNVAFRNTPGVLDHACPNDQTDVDCSGATDVLDVVRFVNVAFRNADQESEFCDPCAP